MIRNNPDLGRVTFVITEEQKELLIKEAKQSHAGNMSHLFRQMLDKRYKLNSIVKRQGDKCA